MHPEIRLTQGNGCIMKSAFISAKLILLTASALLISACAMLEPATKNVRTPAAARAVTSIAPEKSDMAKVIVMRDLAAPYALAARVGLNGQKVGKLKNSQYLEIYVPPGDHKLSVSYNPIALALGAKQNITVAKGEVYAWEINTPMELAMAGIIKLRFLPIDVKKNPYKISDNTKVESNQYKAP